MAAITPGLLLKGGGKLLLRTGTGAKVAGYAGNLAETCAVQTTKKLLVVGARAYETEEALRAAVQSATTAYKVLMDPNKSDAEKAEALTKAGIQGASAAGTVRNFFGLAKEIGQKGFVDFFVSGGVPPRFSIRWNQLGAVTPEVEGLLTLRKPEIEAALKAKLFQAGSTASENSPQGEQRWTVTAKVVHVRLRLEGRPISLRVEAVEYHPQIAD